MTVELGKKLPHSTRRVRAPHAPAIDTRALEAEIRQVVLGQTGIFPGAVHFLPRGFLVKPSSGKIARAESYRKYKDGIAFK